MAWDAIKMNLPAMKAGEDLTDHQYKFVYLSGDNEVSVCDDSETPLGVLQNNPPYGNTEYDSDTAGSATVTILGVSKVEAGTGTISRGDYVASDADGKAAVGNEDDNAVGIALEDSEEDGHIISVLLNTITPVDRSSGE